ncbi:MAG: hypothetical protein CVV30_06495 [Methanomicrobiales archaeon HGW-Methanomicrobiales-1]|nr:MAG: hypothetical protein CVV30_06495 [Methanomicrobiales archaeon HGW-Methanomicrobiales-1]
MQKFFLRPFFLSFTIGIPFCIFKLLFGISILRAAPGENALFLGFGWLVTIWACTDLLMNITKSGLDLFHLPAHFEYCTIAQVGRIVSRPMVFLAFDTLLSFLIICLMLWSGWIATLSPVEIILWYIATTLNLVSLSLVSLYNEMRKA